VNPWIDPRVRELRPDQAVTYLLAHGWTPVEDRRPVSAFAPPPRRRPSRSGIVSLALVPNFERTAEFIEFMIRLVAVVAEHEGRWAVDVLNDMLATTPPATANGAAKPRRSPRKKAAG